MRNILTVIASLFMVVAAHAQQQPTETFGNFVGGLPGATTLAPFDQFYVLQGGASKKVSLGATPLTVTGLWAFTTAPTVPTQSPGDNSTNAASTGYTDAAVAAAVIAAGNFPAIFPTNASGLNTTVNGTVGAGSSALTLAAPWDIKANQGIWIPKAGAANTASTPTISGITVNANATNLVFVSGASPAAGDTVSIQFACTTACAGTPAFDGAGITISYTVVAGDTSPWIAWKLSQLVAANASFNNAGLYVTYDSYPLPYLSQLRVQAIASFPALTLTLTSPASVTLGQHAIPTTFVFTGTATGQTVSLTYTSASLSGSPITQNYTVMGGDTAATVAASFQAQMVGDGRFAAAGIFSVPTVATSSFGITPQVTLTATPLTVTPTPSANVVITTAGSPGANTTVAYNVIARDANGGFSVPSATVNATNSNDPTLNLNFPGAIRYNRNPAIGGTNTVKWSLGDANAVDVVVCRNNIAVAVVPYSEGATTGFVDEGQFGVAGGWPDVPSCTAVASQPAPLITTVSTVVGTAVTLASPAITAVTMGPILHDDGVALQTMLTAGCHVAGAGTKIDGYMVIPVGNYNIHQQLICVGSAGSAVFIQGQGGLQRIGDRSGSFISYYGRGDQSVLHLEGVNGSTIQDFLLYGNYIAKWLLQVGGAGVDTNAISGDHYNRIGLWRPNMSAASAGAMFGPECSNQLSEQFFQGWYITQDIGSKNGFISNCGGNQKNFTFLDMQVDGFHNSFSGPSTGVWSFKHSVIGGAEDNQFTNISNLDVDGIEGEGLPNSRLVFINNSSGTNFLHINGAGFNTPPPSVGFFALEATNLPVTITNSNFGAGTWQGEYRMNGSSNSPNSPWFSFGNFFEGSTTLPFYVGGNRVGAPPVSPNGGRFIFPIGIISNGDFGQVLIPSGSQFVGSSTFFQPMNLLGGSYIQNQLYLRQWLTNQSAAPANDVDIFGSGIRSRTMADPGAPVVTVLGTPAALTCSYQVAFRDAAGFRTTALSPVGTTTTCNTPRNNQISIAIAPQGAYFMDVIDNVSGMLVGTANLTQPGVLAIGGQAFVFKDTGQTQTTYSPPSTVNNTGAMVADGQMTAGAYATSAPTLTACPTANSYTVTATDSYLIINDAASTCTVTLLDPTKYTGRVLTIKTTQANTVVSASSNVIARATPSGTTTAILAATAGLWSKLVSNGTSWVAMEGN